MAAGDNISIVGNIISSTGGGSINQSDLDLKQNILNDITQNSIKAHRIDLSNLHMNPGGPGDFGIEHRPPKSIRRAN